MAGPLCARPAGRGAGAPSRGRGAGRPREPLPVPPRSLSRRRGRPRPRVLTGFCFPPGLTGPGSAPVGGPDSPEARSRRRDPAREQQPPRAGEKLRLTGPGGGTGPPGRAVRRDAEGAMEPRSSGGARGGRGGRSGRPCAPRGRFALRGGGCGCALPASPAAPGRVAGSASRCRAPPEVPGRRPSSPAMIPGAPPKARSK